MPYKEENTVILRTSSKGSKPTIGSTSFQLQVDEVMTVVEAVVVKIRYKPKIYWLIRPIQRRLV